jgi:cobalt-zinc-cadmium efflux system membrane fusion protein
MTPRHNPSASPALVLVALASIVAPGCGSSSGEHPAKRETSSSDQPSDPTGRRVPYLKFAEASVSGPGGVTIATGKVAFDEDHTSRVGSPLSGRVEALLVKPGDAVKKGQSLLSIVSPDVEAAIADARAADADSSLQKRTLERLRDLVVDKAVAHKDVQQAESDVAKADASVERARARLKLLGIRIDEHTSLFTLRAPLSGTVVERSALPGVEVRADSGTPLVTISDLDRVWVLVDVYEKDLAAVRAGQTAQVSVASYPGVNFPARIEHVGDLVDPQTRTVKVRLVADNPQHSLKPEMFARVSLPLAGTAAITVPGNAVLSDGESNVVIVAMGEGKFAKRRVEVGSEMDGRLPILSGLNPGERVVTDGAIFLKAELENR